MSCRVYFYRVQMPAAHFSEWIVCVPLMAYICITADPTHSFNYLDALIIAGHFTSILFGYAAQIAPNELLCCLFLLFLFVAVEDKLSYSFGLEQWSPPCMYHISLAPLHRDVSPPRPPPSLCHSATFTGRGTTSGLQSTPSQKSQRSCPPTLP